MSLVKYIDLLDGISHGDPVDHIHAGYNFSKNTISSVKMRSGGVRDEPLSSFSMRPGRSHAHIPFFVIISLSYFGSNRKVKTAIAITSRTTGLNDKIGYDAMKIFVVVKTLFSQFKKIGHRSRFTIRQQG